MVIDKYDFEKKGGLCEFEIQICTKKAVFKTTSNVMVHGSGMVQE